MAEYTEAFAGFILECKRAYEDMLASIDRGDVPPGKSATVRIELTPAAVDRMRFDVIAANHG